MVRIGSNEEAELAASTTAVMPEVSEAEEVEDQEKLDQALPPFPNEEEASSLMSPHLEIEMGPVTATAGERGDSGSPTVVTRGSLLVLVEQSTPVRHAA